MDIIYTKYIENSVCLCVCKERERHIFGIMQEMLLWLTMSLWETREK